MPVLCFEGTHAWTASPCNSIVNMRQTLDSGSCVAHLVKVLYGDKQSLSMMSSLERPSARRRGV